MTMEKEITPCMIDGTGEEDAKALDGWREENDGAVVEYNGCGQTS